MYELRYTQDTDFYVSGFNDNPEVKRTLRIVLPEGKYSLKGDRKWYHKMFGIPPKPVQTQKETIDYVLPENPTDFNMEKCGELFKEVGLEPDTIEKARAVLCVLKNYQAEMVYQYKALLPGGTISAGSIIVGDSFSNYDYTPVGVSSLLRMIPNLDPAQSFIHPVSGHKIPLVKIIMNLNDSHGWSREQIADWLDTLDVDLTIGGPDGI